MIRPIPEKFGVGFTSYKQLPEYSGVYREEKSERYWNYHFTANCYNWPVKKIDPITTIVDGFSPNLNKSLHVGHLRNLAIARSLTSILSEYGNCRPVALLGASQGVLSTSIKDFNRWCDFVGYKPEIFYDVLQPVDYVNCRLAEERDNQYFPEDKPPTGTKVYDGPNGPIIVVRKDGRPTYAFADLAFAASVKPTHYITGDEQKEHFKSLGLGDKHLPMGLVLGKDGKKMKSRTGDAPSASEILKQIEDRFEKTPEPHLLAWNVLAWNFLSPSRSHTVKYDPEKWTNPDQPGLYITYTYARMKSALAGYDPVLNELNEFDVELLGTTSYSSFYEQQCIENMDSSPLANFALTLAKKLNLAYQKEKIQGGRPGFQYAVFTATKTLGRVLRLLGMFEIEKV